MHYEQDKQSQSQDKSRQLKITPSQIKITKCRHCPLQHSHEKPKQPTITNTLTQYSNADQLQKTPIT